ncbi:MAG: MerC domain-containing protein [Elusimicrobia bacterium]|jgi:hypothetical protein|nr:MerC domain-containing protein [Elusimicrobiota bacterium]MBP9698414.1 MerC domain-containing protein [Elusimicrobiota bacterium]
MKSWWNITSLGVVCCTSFCFLGLPILAIWTSALGLGWLSNNSVMRAMSPMFLAIYGVGSISAYLTHRRAGPGMTAIIGAVLSLGAAWHKFPHAAGWLGLAILLGAWFWDWRLVKSCGQG